MVDSNFIQFIIIIDIWIGVPDNDPVKLDHLNNIFDLYFDSGI
jgi:hypothetical protein